VTFKPTVAELGIDPAAQAWHGSGYGDGTVEIAFAHAACSSVPCDRAEWVLMRVTGDPEQRVLVFDRHEWECFLDGARNGEFDDAATSRPSSSAAGPLSSAAGPLLAAAGPLLAAAGDISVP
jgi:Domain of unknown function (DUF397)